MEKNPAASSADISGMDPASAKEYILGFISTVKLTEKKIQDIDNELDKWNSRVALAQSGRHTSLAQEAEKQVELLNGARQQLTLETSELRSQIEEMRRQLPLLAARERSVDPDLLEQELLIAAGYLPGEEEKARANRQFSEMEKDAAAEAALSELKAKMEKS
jgi:phage shock protein A